jgi:hypothetical protein
VDVVGEPLLLAVDGPVPDLELLAHEVLGRGRHEPAVDPEGPADVVDDHPALGRSLAFARSQTVRMSSISIMLSAAFTFTEASL